MSPEDPNSLSQLGRFLVFVGLAIVVAGLALQFREHLPFLKYFGRLPGDFSWGTNNVRVYFPLATSILLSLILSLVIWWLRR